MSAGEFSSLAVAPIEECRTLQKETPSSLQLPLIEFNDGGALPALEEDQRNGGQRLAFRCSKKHRGGYYTPAPIAAFLSEWAIESPTAKVLEPSAGDGTFISAAVRHLGEQGRIIAVELFHDEAEKAAFRGGPLATVITGDFFSWFSSAVLSQSFDVVLGNPPFIRYQDFPDEHRQPAFSLMNKEGLHPNRLTNAWLPFVVAATVALKSSGRIAMVVPAELLQVNYAGELREYLARKYSHLMVVTFRKLTFPGIQEETVLLLGVRQDSVASEISFVELDGVEELSVPRVDSTRTSHVRLNHGLEKWTQFFLTPKELGLIRELESSDAFCKLGELAEVDVGVVTGRNEYFVLTQEEAKRFGVWQWCLPLVGRSAQIPGLLLRAEDWRTQAAAGAKCFLVQFGKVDRNELEAPQLTYVDYGESERFHEGYKCRIRQPRWWNVPSVWQPDAFLLRQIHDSPRIVENRASVICTDTIHRIRIRRGVDRRWLAAASLNSLMLAFAEIRGRSYGGGVLELEPKEAEGLPFPKPTSVELTVDDLDVLLRSKGLEETLAEVDRHVLGPAGLSARDIEVLRDIWRKLSSRRMNRKRRHSV